MLSTTCDSAPSGVPPSMPGTLAGASSLLHALVNAIRPNVEAMIGWAELHLVRMMYSSFAVRCAAEHSCKPSAVAAVSARANAREATVQTVRLIQRRDDLIVPTDERS